MWGFCLMLYNMQITDLCIHGTVTNVGYSHFHLYLALIKHGFASLQQFQVVATENVNPVALQANIHSALATEKLDGTCCYVTVYKGEKISE